ncbi:unnamed protein product [Ostreobium quekettii]|uniref:BZIP domain-containing protein n=1 Tax=Ostreobium quekettii TaxID=121088 RepID=A0A8S1IZX8_9CHLO|nr:unnamed protein product [Ostreobium quekettii]
MDYKDEDSLDRMLSSASLPPFCSAELDDLLKLFSPGQPGRSAGEGVAAATPFAHSTPPVPSPNAVAIAHGLPPTMPPSPPPLLGGPADGTVPSRSASWAGTTVNQAMAQPGLLHFSSAGASAMMGPHFGQRPGDTVSNGTDGSHPAVYSGGSLVEGQCSTGGSSGKQEQHEDGLEGPGSISFRPDAQMFISGAPFVFRSTVGKQDVKGEENEGAGAEPGPGAPPQATANRRLEARKERNRRAQRTFRQRQKHKMQDLEAEVAELSDLMNSLKTSNASLSSNVSLLNKVLEVRDEQLLDMQRKEDEADRLRDETMAAREGLKQLCKEGPMYLSSYLQNGQPVRMTETFASHMTPKIAHNIWMVYGREVSECIKLLSPSTHHLTTRVVQLVKELKKCMILFIHLNPENFAKVREVAEAACPPAYTAVRMIKEVVSALELTLEKKHAIVQKWKWLRSEQQRVEAETKAVNAKFNTHLPTQTVSPPISEEYLCNHQHVEKIGVLLKQWHAAKMQYIHYIICEVLTPLQLGRLISVCFPMMPNTLNLGEILATELGENPNQPSLPPPEPSSPQWIEDPSDLSAEMLGGQNASDLGPGHCSSELMNSSPICDDLGHRIVQPGS